MTPPEQSAPMTPDPTIVAILTRAMPDADKPTSNPAQNLWRRTIRRIREQRRQALNTHTSATVFPGVLDGD